MRAFLTGPFGSWELPVGTTVIGRGSTCTVQIKDRRLSRQHIELRWDGSVLVVKDLGSSNGTLVNGDTVFGERRLVDRDLLIFGPVACDVAIGELSYSALSAIRRDRQGRPLPPVAIKTPPPRVVGEEDRQATEPGGHEAIADPQAKDEESACTRQRTETMDPEVITALFPQNLPIDNPDINNPTTKQALTSRQRTPPPIDPAIRSAIDDQSHREIAVVAGEELHTTDNLQPDNSSIGKGSSALQPHLGVSETVAENEPRRVTTEVAEPHNQLEDRQRAIETNTSRQRPAVVGGLRRHLIFAGLRVVGGLLDLLQGLVLAVLAALPWIVAAYVAALRLANAALRSRDGLPDFVSLDQPAVWTDILASLTTPGGWVQMTVLVPQLREHSQQAFLVFFIGGVLAALAIVFVLLLVLIAPTTYHGGPFWHRRLGLVIVECRNGFFPTPVRACLRWFAFLALGWLGPIAALTGQRAPHDLLTGCEVRHKRYWPGKS